MVETACRRRATWQGVPSCSHALVEAGLADFVGELRGVERPERLVGQPRVCGQPVQLRHARRQRDHRLLAAPLCLRPPHDP